MHSLALGCKKGGIQQEKEEEKEVCILSIFIFSKFLSSPTFYNWISDSTSKKRTKGRGKRRSYTAWKKLHKQWKFKEKKRTSLSLPMMEFLEPLTRCWLLSNNLIWFLEKRVFQNLQSFEMLLCISKKYPAIGGQVYMPIEQHLRLRRTWGLLSWSNN